MIISDTGAAELFTALSEAQGAIGNAAKNAKNPHFKSSYADLASATNVSREHLAANGLSVVQSPSQSGSEWVLTTIITHKTGGWIRSDTPLLIGKKDMQGLGSAITYARRYALMSMLNIAAEDDDGNAAANGKSEPLAAPVREKQRDAEPEFNADTCFSYLRDAVNDGDLAALKDFGTTHKVNLAKLNAAAPEKVAILRDLKETRLGYLSKESNATPFDEETT